MNFPSKFPLSFEPLGGLSEIGSNMALVRGEKEHFIIDCGILFAKDKSFGINYLIPDFLNPDVKSTKHVIFTHGHEDHIGAVVHLVKCNPKITIWASAFTKVLLEKNLKVFE